VLLALSTGQKAALLIVAGIFIVFALASSFLFPRSNPDFPGKRLPLFVAVTVALLVAMLTAMAVFAREPEEEGAHGGTETTHTETAGETEPAQPPADEEAQGDAEAGKAVFAEAGCGGCHTLADAGSSGNIGPNLDELQPDHDLVATTVTNGKGAMPPFQGQLDEEQIQDVAAYVSSVAGS
jgi:mono/diheme cytochrome c family protein